MHKTMITSVILTASILLLAPLMQSGKTANAVMILELLGLALLVNILWNKTHSEKLYPNVKWFIFFCLISIIVYVIPLPYSLWYELPNRLLYHDLLNWIGSSYDIKTYNTLSLAPLLTISMLLSCIPALAIFLTTVSSSAKTLKILTCLFLLSATIQASLGLAQYLTHILPNYFDNKVRIVGTYLNTNHFTTFMEMAEPLALALFIYALIDTQSIKAVKIFKIFIFAIVTLLLTFLAYTTTSRMGIALLIFSIIISFWIMTTPSLRKKVALPIFSIRLTLLGIIIFTQYQMISNVSKTVTTTIATRSQPEVVLGDLRWDMFRAAWEGIVTFFPIGSGPGTMPQIIPAFLPKDNPSFRTGFVNHVHNDYLELLFETGLIGLAIILAFLSLYSIQWLRINRTKHSLVKLLQSGAGIGILIFLIFSLTDFNLHTPANALTLSFLCGIFFRKIDSNDTKPEQNSSITPN